MYERWSWLKLFLQACKKLQVSNKPKKGFKGKHVRREKKKGKKRVGPAHLLREAELKSLDTSLGVRAIPRQTPVDRCDLEWIPKNNSCKGEAENYV